MALNATGFSVVLPCSSSIHVFVMSTFYVVCRTQVSSSTSFVLKPAFGVTNSAPVPQKTIVIYLYAKMQS